MVDRRRDMNRGQDLPIEQCSRIDPSVEVARRDITLAMRALYTISCAEGQHDRGHVVARIAIGGVAAEGPAVANLRVGDHQRGFAYDRAAARELLRADQFMLR